jgi:hypothetical protein
MYNNPYECNASNGRITIRLTNRFGFTFRRARCSAPPAGAATWFSFYFSAYRGTKQNKIPKRSPQKQILAQGFLWIQPLIGLFFISRRSEWEGRWESANWRIPKAEVMKPLGFIEGEARVR